MLEIRGKFNIATVFTDNIEESAVSQIVELCNQSFVKDSTIVIMPDVHAGIGCVIGTTMTIKDKVVPNLVGVDIGCGMLITELKTNKVDLEKLDNICHRNIPSGTSVRSKMLDGYKIDLNKLKCANEVNLERAYKSIGTLGGGNHFIEIEKSKDGKFYLVVHSGSRNLGKQIAEYYQNLAKVKMTSDKKAFFNNKIQEMKDAGEERNIEPIIVQLKENYVTDENLAYLEKEDFNNYLHDMKIAQEFASLNRKAITNEILAQMNISASKTIETVHNYISMKEMMLRKGAVSAQKKEELLIPMNMKDGSLLCIGKGNKEWNCSAPHGAGRVMSRSKAKEAINMEEYTETMKDVYSTCVGEDTLDEAPQAYKPTQEIINNIQDTVSIVEILTPVYNFKAGKE